MQRTLQFFRITHQDGSPLARQFPSQLMVQRLKDAEDQDKNRRYITPDRMDLLAESISDGDLPSLGLYRRRRANLPRLDDNGKIVPLPLTTSQALAELTYFSFLPRNIVALVFNNEGPRPKRLVEYVNAKFSANIKLTPIIRDDLAEVLDQLRLSALTVSIPSEQIPTLARGDDWAEALDAAGHLAADGAVQLRISVGRYGTQEEKAQKRAGLRDRLTQLRNRGDLSKFNSAKAEGQQPGNKTNDTIDLLEENFIMRVEMPDEELTSISSAIQSMEEITDREWVRSRSYLVRNAPAVQETVDNEMIGSFVEDAGDGSAEEHGQNP